MSALKRFVDEIIEDGVITSEEHQQFTDLVHADGVIDAEESEQISRIFRLVAEGKVAILDESRDVSGREELERAKAEFVAADEAIDDRESVEVFSTDSLEKRKAEVAKIIAQLSEEREASRNRISEFMRNRN